MELINRKPSACLLCRHDLGSELARQLSPCPHDPHVLVASVDDGCREVKVIFEGGEEVGDESGCEDDGERGGRVEVEEIGQKVEEGEAPIEKVTNTEGKEGTPTEKEESLTEKEESLRPKSEVDNEELHLAQEEKEEGGGAKDNGEDSTLRQRKKADKINTRRGHPEMAHPVNRDAQPSMREEQFAVELGEKHQSDFKEGEDALQKVAKFSFDGKLVVTGGVDGCVRVWKVRGGEGMACVEGEVGVCNVRVMWCEHERITQQTQTHPALTRTRIRTASIEILRQLIGEDLNPLAATHSSQHEAPVITVQFHILTSLLKRNCFIELCMWLRYI